MKKVLSGKVFLSGLIFAFAFFSCSFLLAQPVKITTSRDAIPVSNHRQNVVPAYLKSQNTGKDIPIYLVWQEKEGSKVSMDYLKLTFKQLAARENLRIVSSPQSSSVNLHVMISSYTVPKKPNKGRDVALDCLLLPFKVVLFPLFYPGLEFFKQMGSQHAYRDYFWEVTNSSETELLFIRADVLFDFKSQKVHQQYTCRENYSCELKFLGPMLQKAKRISDMQKRSGGER